MQVKAFPTHLGNLLITDDFAPPVLQRAISELSRQAIWQYGWRSNTRRDRYCYWHAPIAGGGSESRVNCEAELAAMPRYAAAYALFKLLQQGALKGHEPVRVYLNSHTFGVEGYVHQDNKDTENYFSTVYYAHPVWHQNWSGDTVFFNRDESDILTSVFPRPGRAVTFHGAIPHCARAPSRDCNELRVSLVSYFQARRVGDSVARIRELENIRSFLTGNAITLVLDLLFSGVFIAVMFWYSVWLTLVVLASIPLYVGLSLLFTPVLRARLNVKFNRGAENQSFLVETLSGIDTVKAMAVEPRWQQKWEQQLAGYVAAGLASANVANVASGGVSLVSKLVTAAIMWLGASLVVDGQLTVGQLIAFNMLSGHVATPILRLAQLWNDFQQIGISMGRLGDILNVRTEVVGQKTRIPRISGAIEFDQVSFRYRPDAADVLRNVQLAIKPGEVIGIVGRSGSGKSTLTKLAQRLYLPDRGRVLVDGQDIAVVDTASLRQQIGVVLQENTLFGRSVRDNIALVNPAMPIEAIIEVAKLAGAHEFICELAEGYDTLVGEHGTGLSGGQRQRIAIARALLSNPRILIFDEATSALDYESEKIIQDNMRRICAGRTVLIIAHRLSAVRDADRIVVMERGAIAEMGCHAELLQNTDGIYSHLHRLQQGLRGDEPGSGAGEST